MRLRSLRLRNYRRFRDARLEFPDGVIAVTGPNGAGKSTIIESVTWCLFGHEAARTHKDLLKRTGAAPGDDVEVRLEFELDGAAYVVTRRLRGRSQQSEAQLEVDGALVVAPGANSAEATARRVAAALGMDRRGFQATVVANQGDLSALSDTHPGDRKRLILGLLGVDAVDAAIVLVRTRKREAVLRLDQVRLLAARAAELRTRRTRLEEEAKAAHDAHGRETVDVRQRREEADRLREEAEALATRRQQHRDLRSRVDGLQRALQAQHDQAVRLGADLRLLEQRSHELERLRAQAPAWDELDARLAALEADRLRRAERERLVAEAAALDAEIARWEAAASDASALGEERLQRDLAAAQAELEAIGADLVRLEAHAGHLASERRRLETDAIDHGDRWRELQHLGPEAPCPVCERLLGDAATRLAVAAAEQQAQTRTRVERIEAEREETGLRAVALRRDHDEVRRTVAVADEALSAARRDSERHRLATLERERAARRRAALEEELLRIPATPEVRDDAALLERSRRERDRWRQQVARLEAEVARADRVRADLAVQSGETETTRRDIEAATRELAHLAYAEGTWENAQQSAERERTRLNEAERRRDVLAERLAGHRAQLEAVVADLATLAHVETEAGALQEQVRVSEALAADRGDQGLLPEFRRHLIGRIRPALARAAGDLVAEMTGLRYTELAIDEDYGIKVFDAGQAWPAERFSGGEVDIINLAVRLAVSELLARARRASRLQFVALDEVLAAQDETRRRNVLLALKGLGRHFRQVLLVTHLDEVREQVDHVIRVVPGPEGMSRFETSWTREEGPSSGPARRAEAAVAAPSGRSSRADVP